LKGQLDELLGKTFDPDSKKSVLAAFEKIFDDPDPRRSTFRGKLAGKSTTTQGDRHPQRRLTNQRIPTDERYTGTSDLTFV
jgi:hypothetical protein